MPDFRRARGRARALLTKHGINSYPVDVHRLARLEGVEVDRSDFGEEISGLLVKDGARAVIGVNGRDVPARQRFTIAHELGHFLLHDSRELFVDRDFVVHFRNETSSTGYDALEVEANQFAAELLMPAEKVRELFSKQPFQIDDKRALKKLAAAFGVSPMAIAVRLSTLELLVAA